MDDDSSPRRALPDELAASTRASLGLDGASATPSPSPASPGPAPDPEPHPAPPPPPPPRPRRGRRRLRTFAWIVGVLALVLALGIAGLVYRGSVALREISRNPSFLPTGEDRRPVAVDGPLAFLLIGSDRSSLDDRQEGSRSDTLMVAYLPDNREHVYLISIPRDLWVNVPDLGYAKVNAAYDNKGAAGSVEVAEDLLATRMNHVAMVDFAGFVELMDVLGGVDVENPEHSEYWFEGSTEPTYVFPQGTIHLQGEYGLAYVRQRHGMTNGDLDRTARQRAVTKAIIAKSLSAGVLSNPVTLNDLLHKVSGIVEVDHQLTDGTILGVATSLKIKNADSVRTLMLPIAGYDESDDGQSIDVPDLDRIAELGKAMRTDTMDAYWAQHSHDELITENRPWYPGNAPAAGTTEGPTLEPSALPTGPHPEPGASRSAQTPATGPS